MGVVNLGHQECTVRTGESEHERAEDEGGAR